MGVENRGSEHEHDEHTGVPAGHPEKPSGEEGRTLLERMNAGKHEDLSLWGLAHLSFDGAGSALDIGCGGGANIARLLERMPDGRVCGVDYSELSVQVSRETNADAIAAGRCEVREGIASELPFEDGAFDIVTAFETVYYWELAPSFAEVLRVLRPGGTFLVCNEDDGSKPSMHEFAARIPGMVMYTGGELKEALLDAGFSSVEVDESPDNDDIAVVAVK